jgi:molybdenum cofactor cytidylyltransferase
MEIYGILLAAGMGTRFGGDKLTAPLHDGTPIALAAARNLHAVLDEVRVVVRDEDIHLARLVSNEGFKVVYCSAAGRGMSDSIACGVAATPQADGWLIALGDMPFIRPQTIKAVVDYLRSGALIAAPNFRGKRSHPVGFSAALREELLNPQEKCGALSLLQCREKELVEVPSDDPGLMIDIDTPADLCQPGGTLF